ncbi:MAG TPA: hypothetical protein VLK85_24680 [Ramlibacter sp.]|nr:hypothetical protein [Ramlibacter sp.]
MTDPARSWPDIVARYQALARTPGRALVPMRELVEFLAASRYARTLVPATEQEVLRIGRTADGAAAREELRIRFDESAQQFEFTHLRPDASAAWSRECGADEWRPVLERLLHKRLQWFHEG